MHRNDRNDLRLLVIGHVDREEVDAVLRDPMPGGSGLIEQMLERFSDVLAAAAVAIVAETLAVLSATVRGGAEQISPRQQ
ncbi:MAG: hypothetical protein LLG08_08030 [Actinomycetia bacterium]|nr:hypothetical protein [Actinomycetes bacterium]